ncbi:MAG: hypothetical protein IPI48_07295 [bacterium]|nr:hypothetical protein [bacterium]
MSSVMPVTASSPSGIALRSASQSFCASGVFGYTRSRSPVYEVAISSSVCGWKTPPLKSTSPSGSCSTKVQVPVSTSSSISRARSMSAPMLVEM